MFTQFDVLETIDMVEREHLDIRTITMGLSLFSCVRSTAEETAKNVYDLVCRRAEKIVKTASELSGEYGIPIVNKRVSVTPVSLISAAFPEKAPLIGKALDEAAKTNPWAFGEAQEGERRNAGTYSTGAEHGDPMHGEDDVDPVEASFKAMNPNIKI